MDPRDTSVPTTTPKELRHHLFNPRSPQSTSSLCLALAYLRDAASNISALSQRREIDRSNRGVAPRERLETPYPEEVAPGGGHMGLLVDGRYAGWHWEHDIRMRCWAWEFVRLSEARVREAAGEALGVEAERGLPGFARGRSAVVLIEEIVRLVSLIWLAKEAVGQGLPATSMRRR